jgi:hypothetical protein
MSDCIADDGFRKATFYGTSDRAVVHQRFEVPQIFNRKVDELPTLFVPADQCIAHLRTVVPGLTDIDLRSQYVGFAAVSAVTVFEIAVKQMFCEFASKKHAVFGSFAEAHFERLNGRIGLKDLRREHVARFGARCAKRFEKLLDNCVRTMNCELPGRVCGPHMARDLAT